MDAEDVDGTDYDKTFIEEPAILDKYKAAADVCESTYLPLNSILIFVSSEFESSRAKDSRLQRFISTDLNIIKDCSVKIVGFEAAVYKFCLHLF